MDASLRVLLTHLKGTSKAVGPRVARLLTALLFGFMPLLLMQSGKSEAVEPLMLRSWFYARGKRPVPHSVTIVRLDKPAYAKINLSPGELFPRNLLADGLQQITRAGAKLIVIDGVPQRPGDDPKADEKLAEALANTPTVLARSTEVVVDSDIYGNQRRTRVINEPIDIFAHSAKAVIPMKVRHTGGVVQEISLSNVRDAYSEANVPLLGSLRQFVSPDIREPGGFDFINFYGGPSTLASLSFAELIENGGKVPEEYFKDRVVFIGAHSDSGTGVEAGKDTFLTPVSSQVMFGVEIHATIAANLMDGTWIRRLPQLIEGMILSFLIFFLSLAILSSRMLVSLLFSLVAVTAWLSLSYFCFTSRFLFLPGVVFTAAVVLVLVLRWAIAAFSPKPLG